MSVTVFAPLCARFSSWTDLRSWLESKEGGSLRVVTPANQNQYAIVRYVKEKSDMSQEHVRAFRSVVWDMQKNRPVCVAPVKAERGEPPVGVAVDVSEFVDGVMMNLWKDASGQVQVATRTNIGATNSFYTSKTFVQMLREASKNQNLQEEFASKIPAGGFLNIVLQHPEHKTVAPIRSPRYFITSSGTVSEDGGVHFDRSAATVHKFDSTGKSIADLMREGARRGPAWQGLVFQELGTMRRWRVRNPDYVRVRTLRGAESDGFERFLRLRASGKTKEYLSYFRDESNEMWAYEKLLRQITTNLFDSYVAMNKLKTKKMTDIDYPLRPHVYALHGKYLASLPTPVPVSRDSVIQYVNGLSVEDQVKLANGVTKSAQWRSANGLA